ncbi:MAG: energy-coupling factor transporter ATPase [Clostridia bacterium]|nr:energy-coupling factor transporter ATPase [Clostridia bacterium]MBR2286934.1 energy-coupling factor transporter ATPase [Clostridia bacterium]
MTDNPCVQVSHVSYTYEESTQPVLKDMSLTVKPGEFLAILGHNGSGKSTLAKLLNGLYLPTGGNILICGMDTQNDDDTWNIRQKAGMIFQNPDNQIVATVVREDVAFGLENMGVPHDEMVERIDNALKVVRMTERAQSEPHMLSGGQKQRVAIAGVLAMQPEIMIADESTAMLDPSGREEVLEVMHRLNREKGMTVIWITHYMEEAAQADRILVVSDGEIALSGTPREVFSQVDRMRELHLDVPHMASLADSLRKDGFPLPAGILTVDEMTEEVCKLLCR